MQSVVSIKIGIAAVKAGTDSERSLGDFRSRSGGTTALTERNRLGLFRIGDGLSTVGL